MAAESFAAFVERLLGGDAPRHLRLAAARGALPLPRATLVRLYIRLRQDAEAEIRDEATKSLAGLDKPAVFEVLSDDDCTADVLDYFAAQALKDEALAERIAFHRSVPMVALGKLAAAGSAGVIELVLTNQERLLAEPELLNVLSLNPALRPEQRGRILELLDRAVQAVEAAVAARAAGATADAPAGELSEDLLEAARLLQLDIGELYAASEILGGDELLQSDNPEIRTAYQRILTLNVAQKAVLAMRGGREERMILVRDTNKLVALGVLRNPRIVDEDIETIARLRNVTSEVLRIIGKNREWTRSYTVINTLVNNPRTPQGVAINFVPRLQNQDLRRLVQNKDVPELIRRMAKRTLDVRTQQSKGLLKKH